MAQNHTGTLAPPECAGRDPLAYQSKNVSLAFQSKLQRVSRQFQSEQSKSEDKQRGGAPNGRLIRSHMECLAHGQTFQVRFNSIGQQQGKVCPVS